jgi:imidazoleglycerol-phosphate dehydratase
MARRATIIRRTKETEVRVDLDIDGSGTCEVHTPIAFLSHMLDQLGRHGLLDLKVEARGDIDIDGHHTTEDVGISIGQCVAKALGERAGIQRYGSVIVPMDDACVCCALDLSGRSFLAWRVPLPKAKVGEFDAELAEVFFEGFVRGMGCNVHMRLFEGSGLHHIIEACFKAFARALKQAVEIDARSQGVPSTKGILTE